MRLLLLVLSIFILLGLNNVSAQQNYLSGKVVDASTEEELIGVNIVVLELENVGAATDIEGKFRIKVPLGTFSLKASLVGYSPVVKTDLVVTSGRETFILIKLSSSSIELNEVTVKADYFDKSIQLNNLSTVVLSQQEVRRSPGSMQDFQRILQAMPGVANSNDQTNELLVRGGAPYENLVIIDDIELRSLNHYPNQYNSGGPINMVNIDLIEDIQFSTGGFTSQYGDKISSIMVVKTREGRRNSSFNGNMQIHFAGAGGVFEGGFANQKGSWLISFRKSYLDFLLGALQLTAVPRYYDTQFKIAYDLTTDHKLTFTGIHGNDMIDIEGAPDETIPSLASSKDSLSVERVDLKQQQYASGISLKSLWGKNFFSTFTVSTSEYNYNVKVNNDFTERIFDSKGKMINSNPISSRLIFEDNTREGESSLRSDFVWILNPTSELSFGAAYKTGIYLGSINLGADTVRYDLNQDGFFDTTITVNGTTITNKVGRFDESKISLYINSKWKFFDERLLVNAGVRYDKFSYSGSSSISPRFSFTYYLIPQISSVNASAGVYYQTLPYPIYGDRFQTGINQNLEDTKSINYILGYEHILGDGLKFNIETYIKNYSQIPFSEEFINFNNRTFRSEKNLSVGKQKSYGLDFVLQQKMVDDLFGTVSFSYMQSKIDDPRIGYEGKTYSSEFEYPYIFTIIVGKRFLNIRTDLDNSNFVLKYLSYALPFSDDMEMSLRWRYSSGSPYTPRVYSKYEQHREGEIAWSGGSWVRSSEIFSERYPDYHRLDFAMYSRFNYEKWNIAFYFAIQNLYNRKNIAAFSYNSNGTKDEIYQFSTMPIIGFEVEF